MRATREVISLSPDHLNARLPDYVRSAAWAFPWRSCQFSNVPLRMLTVLANIKNALTSVHPVMRKYTTDLRRNSMLGGTGPGTVRNPSERGPGSTHGRPHPARVPVEQVLRDDTGSTALLLGTAALVALVCALAIMVTSDVVQYVVAVW